MKLKTKKKLVTILKIIATVCVIPLVFSTFFSGYTIVSEGIQSNIVNISIFEFMSQNDFLLALSFVCMVLQIMLIVFVVFYGMIQTMKKNPNKLLGAITAVFEIVFSIMPFVMLAIFCIKNSALGLKYIIGPCPILYLVCGILFGGLMFASYLIPVKKVANTASYKKVEVSNVEQSAVAQETVNKE